MKRKIDIIALIILIASAVNCGFIGIYGKDVVAWLFGGQTVVASRILYVIVAIAGLWCINLIMVQGRRRSIDSFEKQAASSFNKESADSFE